MISNVYSVKHKDTSLCTCFNTFLKFSHWQDFPVISCECLLFKVSCVGDERDRGIKDLPPAQSLVHVQPSWVVTHRDYSSFKREKCVGHLYLIWGLGDVVLKQKND